MRKILNPYRGQPGYQCFGCSPDNHNGLQMHFMEVDDEVHCHWEPRSFMQGYINVLHGGIQATLMDEIASWLVQVKLQTAGVTSELQVRYLKSVPVDKGNILLKAKLKEMRRNLADVSVSLFNPDGVLAATAEVTYFTFPREKAREKLHFPSPEQFFEP